MTPIATVPTNTILCRADGVVAQEVRDEMVLIHLETNHIFDLGPAAARLWSLLDGTSDRDALVRILLDEYDVGPDRLAADVDRTLRYLLEHELVRPSQGP